MFKITLQLKQKGKDSLELRLPPWMRLIFLSFAVFILYSMVFFPVEKGARGTDYLPILFIVTAFFVTFYEEKWLFNTSEKTIERRFGLIFYHSKETFNIPEIKHIKISGIKKGRQGFKYLKMTLVFNNDMEKDMEMVYFREKEKFLKNARIIADFCKIPLNE